MIRFLKYVVLTGVLFSSLACTPSKTAPALSLISNSCGPQLKGICLAYYTDLDGASYVTQQTQIFYPCQHNLQIWAKEPQGQCSWRLQNGSFSATTPVSKLQSRLFDKNLALSVFYAMTSAAQTLSSAGVASDPVKLEGQWYTPFTDRIADTTITLFQSKDSAKFELVRIEDKKETLLARSYNFKYNETLKKNIPWTIDVFDISDGFPAKKLIVQMQYTWLEPENKG